MSVGFIARRFVLFLLVVWAAATFNFFLPRMASGQNPIRNRLLMMEAQGVGVGNIDQTVKAYDKKFGLDKPLWDQYVAYLGDMSHLDFGYSLSYYPTRVITIIAARAPWTIGLMGTATVLAFGLGTVLGALMGWPYRPRGIGYLVPPLFIFSAIPYYVLGLIFVYLVAVTAHWLPTGGGYTLGTTENWSLAFVVDVIKHSILPALSIVVAEIGIRAIVMRGMMVSLFGEDYIKLAEAKGLGATRIFTVYGMRNAILPQLTWLALALANVAGGAIIVEIIFNYPGLGTALQQAIEGFDYTVIEGIVFFLVVGVALATFVLDILYPLIDPRIRYDAS